VGETDNRRVPAITAFHHHIAAFANGLGFQQRRNLQYVRLDGFVAEKHGEPPHPVHNNPHDTNEDGNVQDEGQRLHAFSGGIGQMILPRREKNQFERGLAMHKKANLTTDEHG
jgi:hypothetical protein